MKSRIFLLPFLLLTIASCNKYLEEKPISNISPESYFLSEADLAAYSIDRYNIIPTAAFQTAVPSMWDGGTDNQIYRLVDENLYAPGQYRVPQSGGDWDFTEIYTCNYFMDQVLPKWKEKTITGSEANINQYIGEMYFLRAFAYFKKLQALGDFPILRGTLKDDMQQLIDSSKRAPRNEVARFILSDLDSAEQLMGAVSPNGTNRLNKACAQLFASRVALYEGTWEKYFKNTAFVPNGPDWPGKAKAYNANYNFPSGSIDNEINYFLDIAMRKAKTVADAYTLTPNNGVLQQSASDPSNPYYDMFSAVDASGYNEVLLWKKYDRTLGIVNSNVDNLELGSIGLTRGMVDGFLMANGLPIYASGSGYAGDDYVADVRKNRDGRLFLFLKEPGQKNVLIPYAGTSSAVLIEPIPNIVGGGDARYVTGYSPRKGLNFDASTAVTGQNNTSIIIFRATEAYMNYIEAEYERNGSLDGDATAYWHAIRTRAGVDPDFQKTINATDMAKEAANDWGSYSGGQLLTDKTLYNIRRERRSEFMLEGMRSMDLHRWRSYDQLITSPYQIEGFKLWGPMKSWYDPATLTYGIGAASTVSDPKFSIYYRPFQKVQSYVYYNGLKWAMAHYLSPIAIQHFLITSQGSDVSSSPIYQNPGWPLTANGGATF